MRPEGDEMCLWDRWLWELGFAVCHQRTDRLLSFGGRPLFVCARDTGMFVAFFGLLLALSLLRRERSAGIPSFATIALCVAGILFLAWDGLTSYLGWRESTNLLRFLSGATGGAGLAVPVSALMNREIWLEDTSRRIMGGGRDILFVSVVSLVALPLYIMRPPSLFRVAQLELLLSMLGTFWSLNLLLICLLRPRRREEALRARIALAFLLLVLELAASYWAHRLLAGGGPLVPPPALFGRLP